MKKTAKNLRDETTDYAKAVVTGKIPCCRYVKLACQRHLDDLKRTDVWFDPAAARRFFRYCRLLHHYKGPLRGEVIELSPWEKFGHDGHTPTGYVYKTTQHQINLLACSGLNVPAPQLP